MKDLPDGIIEAGIDLTLRDVNGKKMTPAQVEREVARELTSPERREDDEQEICKVCVRPIRIMAFKGTGVCCEFHRKIRDGLLSPDQIAEVLRATKKG